MPVTKSSSRLRLRDAARYLDIPDYTLTRYSKMNQVGFYLNNGRRMYDVADLDALRARVKSGIYVPPKAA